MTVQALDRTPATAGAQPAGATRTRLAIADCDIHHSPKQGMRGLYPYLEQRWRDHLDMFGPLPRQAFQSGPAYPKGQPDASRRDAWPPEGGRPGSDLGFMQRQHLDAQNVELGVLTMIRPHPGSFQNGHLSEAVCQAMNRWQVAEWTEPEPRLKASLLVPYEDGEASAREIARWAGDPNYVQVLLLSRTAEPLGQKRYWPIYRAAAEAGLPVGIHAFGYGGTAITAGGWPSYYLEEMVGHAQAQQAVTASMILEGVFERFPKLKVVMIEGGVAWAAALAWRMDAQYRKLKRELPHLQRLPSEYLKSSIWFTTQPIEEPEPRIQLAEVFDWMGWDRILFATDYPHWDFDDPAYALPIKMTEAQRRQVFLENAKAVFGIS